MIKALRIDKTIVVNYNNKMYSKEFSDVEKRQEVYEFLLNADEHSFEDGEKLINYFQRELSENEKQLKIEFEQKKEESKKLEDILDLMKDIRDNGHDLFEVKDNSIYLKGVNISMPELLVREIINTLNQSKEDYDEEEAYLRFTALQNFWYLCAMNPDPRARHDSFRFIEKNGLTITQSGNILTYRRVWTKNKGNQELEKFVTQEYLKVKRWKKSPKNYYVFDNNKNGLELLHNNLAQPNCNGKIIGILDKLYNSISEISETVYTDNHTRTFNIKIGEPIVENRGTIDPDPEVECSRGIHTGSPYYVNSNNWLGDTVLACLVNPKDITAVPTRDSYKMRSCKVLPIAVAELDENGYIVEPDYSVFDYELAEQTAEELEAIKNMSTTEFEEYKKNEFISIEMDFNSMMFIKNQTNITVEEAKEIIENRVIKI